VLAKTFSAVWIAANSRDLLSRANTEYIEWLKDNPPARDPVGWILHCAYWRAQNLLESEKRKPRTAPLDSVFHLADESTPDPEQQALENDRRQRLTDALGHLSDKERKLLALVYFGDHSIREAGRKLGWRKSAADRHHKAAMEKMHALVGDRSLLSPAILGPAAYVAVNGEGQRALRAMWDLMLGPAREAFAASTEAIEIGAHRLAELARRLLPFADTGNAAASSGAGRFVGYCGVAVGAVVCGLISSGSIGPGTNALRPDSVKAPRQPAESRATSRPEPTVTPKLRTPPLTLPKRTDEAPQATEPTTRKARDPRFRFPRASGKQSSSEFGDNTPNFGSGSAAESSPPTEAPAESSPAPAPAPSSGSSGSQSSGSQPASEFGL